jgi:hypothetical protein
VTFTDEHDAYAGHTWDEYDSAYNVSTGLPRDGDVGYTC